MKGTPLAVIVLCLAAIIFVLTLPGSANDTNNTFETNSTIIFDEENMPGSGFVVDASLQSGKDNNIEKEIFVKYYFGRVMKSYVAQQPYDAVTIPGLTNQVITGEPVIPFNTAKILIPQGMEIDEIEVVPGKKEYLGKFYIEPGQEPVPISSMLNSTMTLEPTLPSAAIYESEQPYPKDSYSIIGTQNKYGFEILYINLYPISYLPKTNKTFLYQTFNVTVTTKPAEKLAGSLFRGRSQDREIVASIVDNRAVSSTYVPVKLTGSSPLLSGNYDYVIITSQALKDTPAPNNFQALVNWKNQRGLSATIVTVEEIYNSYGGYDNQEKIRNFIRDAYQNNGVNYVLLGGDADGANVGGESGNNIVPVRGLWAWSKECNPPNIASDLYYACLDGNFDNDGDKIYGEPGEADLLAEVYVGRAPVDSSTEVRNFVRKTIDYESSTIADPYLRKVWMVGERLGFGGIAEYAGNYKDQIKDDSSADGYTTKGFPDEDYDVSTLYDRTYTWSKSVLINIINGDIHTINHLGHANPLYVMKMGIGDVDALTNDQYFFGYSQGCYSGSFDNRGFDPSAGGSCQYLSSDCILEHFVTGSHGAFGFIGNSRYGWGRSYSTDGPSQRFDRQFWDAIFGEGIRNIGRANQDSKEDNVGSISSVYIRFCYYEINLLGDPETPYFIPSVPTVTNSNGATSVTSTSARLNGALTNSGGENSGVYIYWGDSDGGASKTAWDNGEFLGVKGVGAFNLDKTGLTPGTTYYYRCYANNSYGEDWADSSETFETLCITPTITNAAGASDITPYSARVNGELTDNGDFDPAVYICWGESDGGISKTAWDNEAFLGVKGIGDFHLDLTSLSPGTTYYYRCYASSSCGEDWADASETFETLCIPPTITNAEGASYIAPHSARLNGAITDTGGENPEIYVYWGDSDGGTNFANWDYVVNLGMTG